MKAIPFQSELITMTYFKAPASEHVKPYVIKDRTEVVELVNDGVVYFRNGDREQELGCGALFWHVAGEETIHRTAAESPYECLALVFSAREQKTPPERPVPRLSLIADPQRTRELSRELLRAYHDASIDRGILGSYARSRLLWETHLGSTQNPAAQRPGSLEAALKFVGTEFHRAEIGVKDLAHAAEISEPHLHVLFRKYLDQTPHQALLARRIQEARWQLSGTFQTIKAIAVDCGFQNIETFYRAFKRSVGTTPDHFRKSHRSLPHGDR